MSLRGAIVGFGKIAESTHLPALSSAGLEVVAIVEPNPSRLEAARAVPSARCYATLEELLDKEKLDFVDVCTPPHLHLPATLSALERGLHVLCEKPLVLRLEEGTLLARTAAEAKRVVTCMHNWTQAPILRRVGEWIRSGELGRLEAVELVTLRTEPAAVAADGGNWRIDPAKAGGGILFDHGWHGVSILLRLVGAQPLSVAGRVARRRFLDLPVEDTAELDLLFEGGVRGRFEATWAATERANRARVRLSQGEITLDGDRLTVTRGTEPASPASIERFDESLAAGGYRPSWSAGIVREFRDEIAAPSRYGTSLREALLCLEILHRVYASAKQDGLALPIGSPAPSSKVAARHAQP